MLITYFSFICVYVYIYMSIGADSDIIWLQRDFGIYVVNLFDTG